MDQTKNATLEQVEHKTVKEKEKNEPNKDTEIKKENNSQDLQQEISREERILTEEELQAYRISRQNRVIACLTHLGMQHLIPKK